MASLVAIPTSVLGELSKLVFDFFWKGKRDLVSRPFVVQHLSVGGFYVVESIKRTKNPIKIFPCNVVNEETPANIPDELTDTPILFLLSPLEWGDCEVPNEVLAEIPEKQLSICKVVWG